MHDYNPRHDPTFADRLLALLKENAGQPVRVHRELGIEHCGIVAWRCVNTHVKRFRRHGHTIIGGYDGTYTWLKHSPRHRLRGNGVGCGRKPQHDERYA